MTICAHCKFRPSPPASVEIPEYPGYELRSVKPKTVTRLEDGAWLVDFGRECVGGVELTAPEGEVEVRLGEDFLVAGHNYDYTTQFSPFPIISVQFPLREMVHALSKHALDNGPCQINLELDIIFHGKYNPRWQPQESQP